MNKQEFLGSSLHTGLKFDVKTDLYQYPILVGIRQNYLEFNYHGTYLSFPKDFYGVPIARPISDLTKPITHNDETFVPIVELAKIAKCKLKISGEWKVDECYVSNCARNSDHFFWFNGDSFLYSILTNKKEHKMIIHNQQELLHWLVEYHFNLMDKSEEFIHVTDEFNPYK